MYDDIKSFGKDCNALVDPSQPSPWLYFRHSTRVLDCLWLIQKISFNVAHTPEDMASEDHGRRVASLLKETSTLADETENAYAHEVVRAKLLQTTKRIVSALEKPGDAVFQPAFLVHKYLSFQRLGLLISSSLAGSKYVCKSGRRPRSLRVDSAREAGASDGQGAGGSKPSRAFSDR